MGRSLSHFACVVSLLMCAATLAVWLSTLGAERMLNSPRVHASLYRSGVTVVVDHGKVRYGYNPQGWDRWWTDAYALPNGSGSDDSVWGFNLQHVHYPNEGTKIGLPYWLQAALFAVLPFRWMMNRRRRKRRKMVGRCLACGYDLRATPNRCPECGTLVARERAQ